MNAKNIFEHYKYECQVIDENNRVLITGFESVKGARRYLRYIMKKDEPSEVLHKLKQNKLRIIRIEILTGEEEFFKV